MINHEYVKRYCKDDISLIENYDIAISDTTQTWVCHHRLEIQNGISISIKELKEKGLYFHRPANELIFMTEHEHKILHGELRTTLKGGGFLFSLHQLILRFRI